MENPHGAQSRPLRGEKNPHGLKEENYPLLLPTSPKNTNQEFILVHLKLISKRERPQRAEGFQSGRGKHPTHFLGCPSHPSQTRGLFFLPGFSRQCPPSRRGEPLNPRLALSIPSIWQVLSARQLPNVYARWICSPGLLHWVCRWVYFVWVFWFFVLFWGFFS